MIRKLNSEFFSLFKEIPIEFNWAISHKNDTKVIRDKKKLISSAKNQFMCGSCWAISCTTAMSDAYVISGLVDWSPKISYTYVMSKYPQDKCLGGSGRILLEDIKNGDGVASDYCVDDSWCRYNKYCATSDSSQHFNYDNKQLLSSLIPSEGCYDSSKKHYVYYIDDVYTISFDDANFQQETIKKHIMVRGPVVAAFLIKANFVTGDFTPGVYIEDGVIIGSHSVVVVGWGIYKGIPYWYCRNSWGTKWGENGYFKLAMYPHNRTCQFTKEVRVIHKGEIKEMGGVTGFKVSRKPELKYLKSNNFLKDKNDIINSAKKSLDKYVIIFLMLISTFFLVR